MSELVAWKLRSDVVETEDCWVGTSTCGEVVGYVQQFKNGMACYWHVLKDQAKPARDVNEAREMAVSPYRVMYIDTNGTKHDGKDDLSPSAAIGYFRNAVDSLRRGEGEARFGKVVRVQLLASNGALLDEQTVSETT
jgi:hypothetical protein